MQAYYIEFIIAAAAIIMLMVEAFLVPRGKKPYLAIAGISVLLLCIFFLNFWVASPDLSSAEEQNWMSRFYLHSGRALIFKNIFLASTILVLLLAWEFRPVLAQFTSEHNSDENTGEFYALPLFTCAGMMWMASATDFVSIFVALELVTICFYVMVAYMRRNVGSLEAGVKYLILGALSTGILVYGIAWLYGAFGTTHIPTIVELLNSPYSSLNTTPYSSQLSLQLAHEYGLSLSVPALFGISLIVIALAFKMGAVPMQLWIPDVYQGAPTPVTAFLSVASKAAGFAIAIIIIEPFIHFEKIHHLLLILAGATLLYGNLAALKQSNFKRLLAYSSISHAGFMLVALAYAASDVVIFYLITYMIMTFAGFFILNNIRVHSGSDEMSVFDGFAKRDTSMAISLTIIMAAMAGLPLTIGFHGKFLVFKTLFESTPNLTLIGILVIGAAAGFYYYFKIIRAMFWHRAKEDQKQITFSPLSRIVILFLTILIVLFGVFPQPLIKTFNF